MMDGYEGSEWTDLLRRIRNDDPNVTSLNINQIAAIDENYSCENWEELGRDISNNTHMKKVILIHHSEALDDQKISFLFRGLTRSSSIKVFELYNNDLSEGVRGMVPFLQNATNLTKLDLDGSNIRGAAGFNVLFRALRDSPIEELLCNDCGIESIEIDSENKPKHLKQLYLDGNSINADGCREIAKLMQGEDATLTELHLAYNNINDDGVEALVDALQTNTSLAGLDLKENGGISKQGKIMLLKLVNDISSIEATLRSNHTLDEIQITYGISDADAQIWQHIDIATEINCNEGSPGRAKVIKTQLDSERRAELSELQGVNQSLYSEIDPLHLPEVLALVGNHHGQEEFYVALKASIAGVISIVNEKEGLKKQWEYHNAIVSEHRAKMDAIEARIAAIEASEAPVVDIGSECRSNKRRRK